MAQVYKELQKENDDKFQRDPSTVSSKGSGFKEALETFNVGNTNPPNGVPEYNQEADTNKLKALSSMGQMSTGGVGSGQDTHSITQITPDAFDTKILGINIGTPSGSAVAFDPFNGFNVNQNNVDVNRFASTAQSNFSKSINTGTQFIGKTAINTVGGIIGGLYSVGSAIAQVDAKYLADNSVNRAFDKATEAVEEGNTIRTHKTGNTASDFFSFNTVKGLSDAASFIAGAVASELIMQTAGNAAGGLGIATFAARATNLFSKMSKVGSTSGKIAGNLTRNLNRMESLLPLADEATRLGRQASKEAVNALDEVNKLSKQIGYSIDDMKRAVDLNKTLKQGLNFTRQTVTSTFWEAGIEARQAKDGLMEQALRYKKYELDNDPSMDEETKEATLAAYKSEVEEYGDKASIATFAGNVAVLRIGNAIQFPSLFGKGTVSKLNPTKPRSTVSSNGLYRDAKGKLDSKTLRELGAEGNWLDRKNFFNKLAGTGRQSNRVGSSIFKYIKNPLTEAAEEYSQYLIGNTAQTYYDNVLNSNYKNNPEIDTAFKGVMHSLLQSFKDSSKNDAWDEAIIGGIMGAIGIPMFRKGKSGNREFSMEGGIWEASKANKQRALENEQTKALFDTDSWNKALTEDLQRSMKTSTITANNALSMDDAVNLGDQAGLTGSKEDALFTNVFEKLVDGSADFLAADIQDIKDMPIQDFIDTFINKEETKNMSEEEVVKYAEEARDTTLKNIETIFKSFDTITSTKLFGINLRMDSTMAGIDRFEEDLLRYLTYSLSKSEIKNKQIEELSSQILNEFNGTISSETLDAYNAVQHIIESDLKSNPVLELLTKELENMKGFLNDFSGKVKRSQSDGLGKAIELKNKELEELKIKESKNNKGSKQLQNRRKLTYGNKIKALNKSIAEYTSLKEKVDDYNLILDNVNSTEDQINEAKKKFEASIEKIKSTITEDVNLALRHSEGPISNMQENKEITTAQLSAYLDAERSIKERLKSIKDKHQLNPESFKELDEGNTIDEKLMLLTNLESDRIRHQRIASYFFKRMDDPGKLIESMFKASAETGLAEIIKSLHLFNLYIEDNTNPNMDEVSEHLTVLDTDMNELEGLIFNMKSKGYDLLEKDPLFKESYEAAKNELEELLDKYEVKQQVQTAIQDSVNTLASAASGSTSSAPTAPATNIPVSKPLVRRKFSDNANRLLLNIDGRETEQKKKYREAIEQGKIKSGALVFLDTDSSDPTLETDEWFNATSIDKDKYNKGKEAVNSNPDLIESAFSGTTTVNTVSSEPVKFKGKNVSFTDSGLANSIANYVKSLNSKPNADIASVVKSELEKFEIRVAEVTDELSKLKSTDPKYREVNDALQDLRTEHGLFAQNIAQVQLGFQTYEETFPQFVTGKPLASTPEAVEIANKLVSSNPNILAGITLPQLVDFVIKNDISIEEELSATPDIKLNDAIKYYVSNYRLVASFTDKPYTENALNNEDANVTFTSYIPAVADLDSKEQQEKVAKLIKDREAKLLEVDKEISKLTAENINGINGLAINSLNKKAVDLVAEIQTLEEQRSDRTNLEFRKEVLKRGKYAIKVPTVNQGDLAKGIRDDFNADGSIKTLEDGFTTKEFNVFGEDGNGLIKDMDDFIENVVYLTSRGTVRTKNIRGEEVVLTTSEGSNSPLLIEGTAGDTFYIYRDSVGNNVPIKLNKGTVSEEIAGIIHEAIDKYFKGKYSITKLRHVLDTFITVKKKSASKIDAFFNSVTVFKDEEVEGTKLVFTDSKGESIEINFDNYKEQSHMDSLNSILTNTRANVFLSNLHSDEGVIDMDGLTSIIDGKLINTDKDVINNHDKVYSYKEDGTVDYSIALTPGSYDPSKDRKYDYTKRSFLKSFKAAIDVTDYDINKTNIQSKITSRLLTDLTAVIQMDIKANMREADSEISALYDKYTKFIKLESKEDLTKAEKKKLDAYLKPIISNSIERTFNTEHEGFRKNTVVGRINGLIRLYPSHYSESTPDLQNTLNYAFNLFNDIKKTINTESSIEQLLEYSLFMGNRKELIKEVQEASRVVNKNKTISILSIGKDNKLTLNTEQLELFKEYISLMNDLNYGVDQAIPIAIERNSIKFGTKKRTTVENAVSIDLSSTGNGFNVLLDKKANARNKDGSFKYSFKEKIDNGYYQYINIDTNTKDNRFYMDNPVIPNMSKEDIEYMRDVIAQGKEVRSKLINTINKSTDTSKLQDSLSLVGEVTEAKKAKDNDTTMAVSLKSLGITELTLDSFTDTFVKIRSIYLADYFGTPGIMDANSKFLKAFPMSKLFTHVALLENIVSKQGSKVFQSDNIIIPKVNISIDTREYLDETVFELISEDYEVPVVTDEPRLTLTKEQFESSNDPDVIALRVLLEVLNKKPKEVSADESTESKVSETTLLFSPLAPNTNGADGTIIPGESVPLPGESNNDIKYIFDDVGLEKANELLQGVTVLTSIEELSKFFSTEEALNQMIKDNC